MNCTYDTQSDTFFIIVQCPVYRWEKTTVVALSVSDQMRKNEKINLKKHCKKVNHSSIKILVY